jgi:hypothetical protein
LIKFPIIRNAIISFAKEFGGEKYSALRNSLIEKDYSFKVDLPSLEDAVSYSLLHHEELTSTISQVNLRGDYTLFFVYLNGDRLYTEISENLYVYSLSDLFSLIAIASYPLGDWCCSGIIADNRLYLGGGKKLHIFEVTTSITQPLMPVTVIDTASWVYKILRVGNELVLGEGDGYF